MIEVRLTVAGETLAKKIIETGRFRNEAEVVEGSMLLLEQMIREAPHATDSLLQRIKRRGPKLTA